MILTAALTLEGMGAAVSSYADPGIPDSFTVDAIRAAGITDENFATAVYESIASRIKLNIYNIDPTWTAKEIIENYKPENLGGRRAVITGNNKGIKDISGIRLLKNASEIRLSRNDIHDISLLERDASNPDKQIYFNGTSIYLEGGNYQNVIPAELIGTANGNITVDSAMTFEPVELHYLYGDLPKTVGLDFGVRIHGAEGGVFNSEYSTAESVNHAGVSWEPYADSVTRHTGTTISMPGNDGDFTVAANANQGKYVVFDFDNTCSIFDVEEQLAIYQLQTMSFDETVDAAKLEDILKTELKADYFTQPAPASGDYCGNANATYQDWIDDITAAFAKLDETYDFTPAGLSEEEQAAIQQTAEWKEFATKMRAMYDCVFDSESAAVAYPWVLYWFTGMTEENCGQHWTTTESMYGYAQHQRQILSEQLSMYGVDMIILQVLWQ